MTNQAHTVELESRRISNGSRKMSDEEVVGTSVF